MAKEIPQDMQDVINEVSTTESGRGDLGNQYKFSDTLLDDALADANVDVTITGQPISVQDTNITKVYNETYNCLDVLPQDPEYIGFNLYMCTRLADTTLASNATLYGTSVVVTSATGITTGKAINILQSGRVYQSLVTNVSGTTITLATPLDYAFTAGATVRSGDWNLNQNGSSTPVIFRIKPPAGVKLHLTAISVSMTDETQMDNTKFGGITALTNGVLARRLDGTVYNYFLITNNRGFYQAGYDIQYDDRAGGTGAYGFSARKDFKKVNGNVISLDGDNNDELQFVIRDNLTGLTEFAVVVHGHTVQV